MRQPFDRSVSGGGSSDDDEDEKEQQKQTTQSSSGETDSSATAPDDIENIVGSSGVVDPGDPSQTETTQSSSGETEQSDAGPNAVETIVGTGQYVADQASKLKDKGTEVVDDATETVEETVGQDDPFEDYDQPRSETIREQTGPENRFERGEERNRGSLGPPEPRADIIEAEEEFAGERGLDPSQVRSDFDQDTGEVELRPSAQAQEEMLTEQILDDRPVLNEGDIETNFEDGEVTATAPPEFNSRFDSVERARIEYFDATQSLNDARQEYVSEPIEDFESGGLLGREETRDAVDRVVFGPDEDEFATGVAPVGAGKARGAQLSTKALGAAAGLTGGAVAGEATRRTANRNKQTETLQQGSEIDVVDEPTVGSPEIAVDESQFFDRMNEIEQVVDERTGEIPTPQNERVGGPEIQTPTNERTDPGTVQTSTTIDQPTSPTDSIISPGEPQSPTIEQPEPDTGTGTEREFPTGESAVIGRTVDEVENQPGELSQGQRESVTEGLGNVGTGSLLDVGTGAQGDIGAGTGLGLGVSVDAATRADVRANSQTANPAQNATGSQTGNQIGQADGLGQGFNVGQGRGFRSSRPRFRPRFPSTDGGSSFGSEGVSDRGSDPIGSQNPLAAGWAAETFEGFAFGGFRETELAEGVDGPSATGELPTETFANPTDEEAEALEDVGGIFGFSLGESDDDGGGLL